MGNFFYDFNRLNKEQSVKLISFCLDNNFEFRNDAFRSNHACDYFSFEVLVVDERDNSFVKFLKTEKIKSNGKHELLYTFKENQDFLYKVEFVGNIINFTSFHYARRNIFESELETKLSISFQFKIEKTISMACFKKT